jgi:hypothetical protein
MRLVVDAEPGMHRNATPEFVDPEHIGAHHEPLRNDCSHMT